MFLKYRSRPADFYKFVKFLHSQMFLSVTEILYVVTCNLISVEEMASIPLFMISSRLFCFQFIVLEAIFCIKAELFRAVLIGHTCTKTFLLNYFKINAIIQEEKLLEAKVDARRTDGRTVAQRPTQTDHSTSL